MDKSARSRGGSGGCGGKPPSGREESPPLTRMDNGESMINNTCNHSHKPPDLARIAQRGIEACFSLIRNRNQAYKALAVRHLRRGKESLGGGRAILKSGNHFPLSAGSACRLASLPSLPLRDWGGPAPLRPSRLPVPGVSQKTTVQLIKDKEMGRTRRRKWPVAHLMSGPMSALVCGLSTSLFPGAV